MAETPKKRVTIAGREKGPGPARYALPPTIGFMRHDVTKPTSPAFTFHGRMSDHLYSIDSSPGPQYFVDAKITRFGRDGTPAYSMLGRMRKTGVIRTPGPGAYSPEKALPNSTQRRPPSYSIGARTLYRSLDTVPAPNKYTLPAVMGAHVPTKAASASFSISGRCRSGTGSEEFSKTPGPGRYNSTDPNVYLHKQPAFSMLGRHRHGFPADSSTLKPGPGSHNPEKVVAHKPRAPAFSLGIRHSEFITPLVVDVLDT
ncbi:outer dense fiber protein 3-like protein 2b [Engraulis encrasicolus]|uniref:outer dense fiber protein 3-like protein 2b n=1 Tax=Engraulis encrasicolus TaxID=184585 RepID=UPI002FD05979